MAKPGVKAYAVCGKLNAGPGGWNCPCCNNFSSPRKGKPKARRIFRRTTKQREAKEIID